MPYPHQHRLTPTGECFLSSMPDELLLRILKYFTPAEYFYFESEYEPCLPTPLVCRRWERLYYSILYRNIDLGLSGWTKPSRINRLEATLRHRLDLSDAVRMVRIRLWQPSDATCEMIAHILTCCNGLRKFCLNTFFNNSTWVILNAAKRAPLATLELGYGGGPSLQMILKHFSLPTLKELSINDYGSGNGEEPGLYPSSDNAHEDLSLLLSSASPCNVTTMELIEPSAPAHVTKSFLQRPARLESLTMSLFGAKYTVDAVQGILDDHCHTLQHISLHTLARGLECLPDFSSFTSLESLQIHGDNLFAESPCRAAARLDAPRLRHLRISFERQDQRETSCKAFASDKFGWLEDFVSHITPTTNRLETVFVKFSPLVSISNLNWMDYGIWPWSYIDQAVGLFADHNVAMTYTQSRYSRKEWDQAVEREKNKMKKGRPA